MLRFVFYYLTALAGIFQLAALNASAQPRWQIGLDAAFLFKRYHSADAGGVFKPNFITATGIGGLHISRSLPGNVGWLESGIIYTPLEEAVAMSGSTGYTSSGGGRGVWIIPTLFRKDINLQWLTQRVGYTSNLKLSLSAGIQHQIVSTATGLSSGTSSGRGAGISYSDRTEVIHRYNPAFFVEPALRLTLIRHRLDALIRLNGTFGLRELIRTNINYSTAAGGISQQATVSYKGSGTGWGLSLRYLIY